MLKNFSHDKKGRNRGFSLIELIIVIVIIGIVSYLSMPLFRSFIEFSGLKKDAWRLLSDLRWYRQLAIVDHNNYKFTFNVSANSYTIDEYDASTNAFRQTLSTVILENDITEATDSTFQPNGVATPSSLVTIKSNNSTDSISIRIFSTTGVAKIVNS